MKFDLKILSSTEKGACVMRTTAGSTVEALWLPKAHVQWASEPSEGTTVSADIPDWLCATHAALGGTDQPKQPKTNGTGTDHQPSFQFAKMYRRVSKNGKTYFSGRAAGAKLALLKTDEVTDDGTEVWSLVLSEAPPNKQDGNQQQRPAPRESDQRDFARTNNRGRPF